MTSSKGGGEGGGGGSSRLGHDFVVSPLPRDTCCRGSSPLIWGGSLILVCMNLSACSLYLRFKNHRRTTLCALTPKPL